MGGVGNLSWICCAGGCGCGCGFAGCVTVTVGVADAVVEVAATAAGDGGGGTKSAWPDSWTFVSAPFLAKASSFPSTLFALLLVVASLLAPMDLPLFFLPRPGLTPTERRFFQRSPLSANVVGVVVFVDVDVDAGVDDLLGWLPIC